MRYTVYVIKNDKGQLYKGITSNFDKRLFYHNTGLGNWTKFRGPFSLLYKEEFTDKTEALKRERYFKSGKGREFLKNILNGA